VDALIEEGFYVWYDEFSLTIGDSLRRSIDKGLAQSKYGLVILSPNFFAKNWPQTELDGLAARESNGKKVILPIWHNVDEKYVIKFSPTLADRVAVPTTKGINSIIVEILKVVEPSNTELRQKTSKGSVINSSAPEERKVPIITINPSKGSSGSARVNGGNFTPGANAEIYLDKVKETYLLKNVIVKADGRFSTKINMPSVYEGQHLIWVKDGLTGQSVFVTFQLEDSN